MSYTCSLTGIPIEHGELALLSFIISRNITKPLSNISQAAASFANGNYQARATVLSDDEVGQLGSAFNEMAIKLEKIDSNRREFLANVTHDLKTPLAVIQALTETLLDDLVKAPEKKQEYLQKILLENKNMNLLISDLLNLAQLESGQLSFHYEKINATKYLRQHFESYQSLMKEKNSFNKGRLLFKDESDCPSKYVQALLCNSRVIFSPKCSHIQVTSKNLKYSLFLPVTKQQV